jgi:hypothetical protein
LLAGACGSDDGGQTGDIQIALLAPKSGPLQFVGESFENIANLAIDNINSSGGVNGRNLALVVEDTETDPAVAAQKLQELIDSGVVAVVGPATSGEVTDAYPVARDNETPIISPSSTAGKLSDPQVTNDGGYMFRNVPDDNIQGIAMAYYLASQRQPAVTSAYVLYEDTDYGDGLRGSFTQAYEKPSIGGSVTGAVPFTQGLKPLCCPQAAANCADAACVISENGHACGTPDDPVVASLPTTCAGPDAVSVVDALVAQSPQPEMVVMVALEQDALQIALAWDNEGVPRIPGMQFFMTDGARSTGFRDGAPSSVRAMCGTSPTYPVDGVAYDTLEQMYADQFNGASVGQEVFGPNVWDAFHLFGLAMAQQAHDYPGEALGGEHLRDALTTISAMPGQTRAADDWRGMLLDIRNGNDIDYDGAAGPNDFLSNGQTIGPYEVWCLSADGTNFDQVQYFDAEDITAL